MAMIGWREVPEELRDFLFLQGCGLRRNGGDGEDIPKVERGRPGTGRMPGRYLNWLRKPAGVHSIGSHVAGSRADTADARRSAIAPDAMLRRALLRGEVPK